MPSHNYIISCGDCQHLGPTLTKDGVNFAFWSPYAAEVDLLLFDDVNDGNPTVIHLSSSVFKSTYYWHVFVHGVISGQIYAYRITRALDDSNSVTLNKVLLDPYAKRVLFPDNYNRFQEGSEEEALKGALKSAVVDIEAYDWGIDALPHHSLANTIIYEMHIKGFTASKTSGLDATERGTYRGLIEKIPYLVELGITTVELMPIYQFDEDDARPGLKNYWGYSPVSFFAPHDRYSSDRSIMGPLNEFRDMVKALHKHGIEVILDVVYNHTAEGDDRGPTFCFKGLDRNGYYIIRDGYHQNFSGCGNSLNANLPVVRSLIIDSLIFWHEKMHVDGFRFDLASILTRDKMGVPMNDNTTLLAIDANRHLAECKLIAEPWDAGGLYQLGAISGYKWREWNGKFRDDVRSFLRGDCGLVKAFILRILGSPDIYNEHEVDPQKSINFVTCHDGFTLYDLVCYSHKHNEHNGEDNRDGNDANYSANYGFEGPTEDKNLNKLRLRQAKNFMAVTMMSYGTPMILMGDEVLRTQMGNNNAYCQDNYLSYLNWDYTEQQSNMLNFTKKLINLRKKGDVRAITSDNRLDKALINAKIQWHGIKPFQPDWSDMSHSIGMLFFHRHKGVYIYLFINAYWEDLNIEIPSVPGHLNLPWYQYVNTASSSGKEITNFYISRRFNPGSKMLVKNHSIVLLICPLN